MIAGEVADAGFAGLEEIEGCGKGVCGRRRPGRGGQGGCGSLRISYMPRRI